jgi:hypothetical protein
MRPLPANTVNGSFRSFRKTSTHSHRLANKIDNKQFPNHPAAIRIIGAPTLKKRTGRAMVEGALSKVTLRRVKSAIHEKVAKPNAS